MLLAARIIAAIENPKDVTPISGRPFGTRAVLKFANHGTHIWSCLVCRMVAC